MQEVLNYQAFKHKTYKQILKICHFLELPLHENHKGPKLFTTYQRVSLLILWKRSKKSLRDFVDTLNETKWIEWLGLKRIPSKSTLHSWLSQLPVEILRQFNKILLKDEKPSLMSFDATGIDSWQRSRHYQKRILEENMPYAKLDILADMDSQLIHDFVLRIKPRHDVLGAATMLKRLRHKVKILADRGYDSEPLHLLARKKGSIMYAPLRDFKVKKPGGKNRRRCQQKDPDYNKRNIVESIFHSLKAVRVSALKSKNHFMKKREMALYVLVHNIEKMNKTIGSFILILKDQFWTRP
jgi:transposase